MMGRWMRDLSQDTPVWLLAPAWGWRVSTESARLFVAYLVRVRIVSESGWIE